MKNEIMVSIICNTYNHEKYIRDALDSFLMQKTDFAFEVLVHDDASTDSTADIIREYEAKYPDIIRPIYQTENQYSKDEDILVLFQYPRARGKYLAFCEGDDYWTDPLKLHKQVKLMEEHPQIDMCAHAVARVDAETKKVLDCVMPTKKDRVLTTKEIILGKGGYLATSSLFYRRALVQEIPEFLERYCLDYFMEIHGSLRGGILFSTECMSAYRWMADGSWNAVTYADVEKVRIHKLIVAEALDILDAETEYTMTRTIRHAQMMNLLMPYRVGGILHELLKRENRELFLSLPFVAKVEVIVKSCVRLILPGKKA